MGIPIPHSIVVEVGEMCIDRDLRKLIGDEGEMLIEKTTFSANIASVGRDIYVGCYDASQQVNESLFQIELREEFYNRSN
jgi:hypothetical protein